MSHALDRWCKAYIGSQRHQINSYRPLDYLDADTIYKMLVQDASGYLYSAMVSIADACNGLRRGYYSWATCKLYYSLFYSLRGLLALRRKGLLYVESKPFLVEAKPSSKIRSLRRSESSGGTHGTIIKLFLVNVPTHILVSQPIDGCDSLIWLKKKREEATYGRAHYLDPSVPRWFSFIPIHGVRKLISTYMSADVPMYAFDPEHAMLALPILAVRCLSKELLLTDNPALDDTDAESLASMFVDEKGKIAFVQNILR